ncbi:hypothetical protein [Rhodophyticola sp.]
MAPDKGQGRKPGDGLVGKAMRLSNRLRAGKAAALLDAPVPASTTSSSWR